MRALAAGVARGVRKAMNSSLALPAIAAAHPGVVNGLFTYTGSSIVPDEYGVLRNTIAGQPSVEGGYWADTLEEGATLGPEMWVNPTLEAGWTNNGDGSYTLNGSTFTRMYIVSLIYGGMYRISFKLDSMPDGDGRLVTSNGNVMYFYPSDAGKSFKIDKVLEYNSNGLYFRETGTAPYNYTISNISVKEIIPKWIAPKRGTATQVTTTLNGSVPFMNDHDFKGMLIEPAMTNKVTAKKANPTDLTNVTKSGDAAAVLSVVNDATALAAAGLSSICTSGNVYKLDNSAGTGQAYIDFSGPTTNVNVHTFSAYIKGEGNIWMNGNGDTQFEDNAVYTRRVFTGTPATTNKRVMIGVQAGKTAYVILPQSEESAFATSPIIGTDTAAAQTRQATVVSAPTEGVFPTAPEILGPELVTNGDFSAWTGDNPNEWNVSTETATEYVTQSSEALRVISTTGNYIDINKSILTTGKLYKITIEVKNVSAGSISINIGAANFTSALVGFKTGYLWADSNLFTIKRAAGATDITIDNVSVKEVIQTAGAQNFAIYQRVVPKALHTSNTERIFSYGLDSNNRFMFLMSTTDIGITNKLFGISAGPNVTYSHKVNEPFDIVVVKTPLGLASKLRYFSSGIWSSWTSWTIDSSVVSKLPTVVPSSYNIGSYGTGNQFLANYPRTAIIPLPEQASLEAYQAYAEDRVANLNGFSQAHGSAKHPVFTYTGGESIVPDQDGKLKWTPPGVPAVEGGKWGYTIADGAELGPELWTDPAGLITGEWVYNGDGTYTGTNATGLLIKYAGFYKYLYGHYRRISFEILSRNAGTVCAVTGGYGTHKSTVGMYEEDLRVGNNNGAGVYGSGFTGTVRVHSMKDIIPKWLSPEEVKSRSISTKKGTRQVMTTDTFKGMLVEPAMTNKVTARKANPTDLSGVVKSGDALSVLSIVNDSAALAAAGLSSICTSGNVYKLDNSAGSGAAYAVFSGNTANLNIHSYSIYARKASGIASLNDSGITWSESISLSNYTRIKRENQTPPTTNSTLTIRADVGAVVYFILPQLEESTFATSPVIGTDTAAAQTRQATVVSAPTAGVFPTVPEILGNELVTANRDGSATTGWSVSSATIEIENSEFKVTTATASHSAMTTVNVTSGKLYKFSWAGRTGTMPALKYSVYDATGAANIIAPTTYSSGNNSAYFWAPTGCSTVNVYPERDSGVTGTMYFDNVSVKEVIQTAGAQNFAIYQRVVPASLNTGRSFSLRADSENYARFTPAPTGVNFISVIKGPIVGDVSSSSTLTAGIPYEVIAIKSALGMAIKSRTFSAGVWSAWSAWVIDSGYGGKLAVPMYATFGIGHQVGVTQHVGNYPRTAIIELPKKSSLAEYQTWIETELTKRGLI